MYISLQMWSLEHTQVPIDRKLKRGVEVTSQDKPDSASLDSKDNKDEKLSIFKQMKSLSQPEDEEQGNDTIFLLHFELTNL